MNILLDISKWDGFWFSRGSDAIGVKLGFVGLFLIRGDIINTSADLQDQNDLLKNIVNLMGENMTLMEESIELLKRKHEMELKKYEN